MVYAVKQNCVQLMPVEKEKSAGALFLLIVSTVIWGGVFHVIKYPLAVAPPFVLLTARFSLTAIVLLPFLLKEKSYRVAFNRENFPGVLLLSLVGICGYNIFFTYGMQLSDPATGSLIIAANPAMTTLLATVWKKEVISPLRWLGILLAFLGLAFIVFQGRLDNVLTLQLGPGNLLLLGAPLVWAIYTIESREVMQRVPSTVLTAALVLLSLPPQAAVAAWQLDGFAWAQSLPFWLGVAYLGILATGVSYLFWNEAVKRIGASRSSVFVNLIPVTSLVIAKLLGQSLGTHHYVGGFIVVLGVVLATRK